jgi:hypothetical protein
MLAWLVSSLLLSCGPHWRKHKLSSLCRMSMISMHNGKECRKGALERSAKICNSSLTLTTNNQVALMQKCEFFYASLFFLLHKFLGCGTLLFPLFFSFINCVIYVMLCSINFHEHCLLLVVLFLVLHECYGNGVCCVL